ncbi:hypothetical protein A3754_06090 [Alcanivorax sp. HI0083]|nr:hypothetical protein A3730_28705 [Alcanivorax sp. HI0044]KZZ28616.1 hypothetical protein A3754_06090 [Alcanivorax sp. HI0083]
MADEALALADEGYSMVYTYDANQENTGIAELLRHLSEQGIEFKDLHSRQSSLEDIFVDLVHGTPQASRGTQHVKTETPESL